VRRRPAAPDLITKDNVTLCVEAAVFYRVVDPLKAVLAIRDYKHGVLRITQTTLRATLGQHDLDDLLANQTAINEQLKHIIDAGTEEWGVNVVKVETKDVGLPDTMKRAMARQAEAARDPDRQRVARGELDQLVVVPRSPHEPPRRRRCRSAATAPCRRTPRAGPRPS
jgi:regulator of protease activity HflC (stomatin/prohibitin superfamily)